VGEYSYQSHVLLDPENVGIAVGHLFLLIMCSLLADETADYSVPVDGELSPSIFWFGLTSLPLISLDKRIPRTQMNPSEFRFYILYIN